MSRYLGRERNKGLQRRNLRALKHIQKLIANQDQELKTKIEQDGIKITETNQNN